MKNPIRSRAFMKTALLVLAMFAANLIPLVAQPKPGEEHKKLQIAVGEWSYSGTTQKTPFGPAGNFTGKVTTKWALNGFFLETRWKDTNDAGYVQEGILVQGYDPEKRAFVTYEFENDGSVTPGTFSINGNVVSATGSRVGQDGKKYQMRFTVKYTEDGRSSTEKAEYSGDDAHTWSIYYECVNKKTSK